MIGQLSRKGIIMSDKADAEARVIGQAMSDPVFRKKLLADPVSTLKGAGVEVPEGVSVQVVEDTATLVHVVLPAVERDGAVADNDLDAVSGGKCINTNIGVAR
jgi:Nitrile hydratase, alpha chain